MKLQIWACSSAGRAPALQESRQNHTSAASGVAYAETRGATTLLDWTEAGPKVVLTSLGLRRHALRRDVEVAPKPATVRLTAEDVKNLSAASGVAYMRLGAIFTSLAAPNPASTRYSQSACDQLSSEMFRQWNNPVAICWSMNAFSSPSPSFAKSAVKPGLR